MKFNVAVIIRCLYNSEFTSYLQLLAGYQQSPYNVSLISYSQNEGGKKHLSKLKANNKNWSLYKKTKRHKAMFFFMHLPVLGRHTKNFV